jgi:TonB family protein
VQRWNRAATLHHPHLVRIFAAGTWTLTGMPLAYFVHGQGLVHGNLKPSNILAVEDTVRISSEAVSAGDPAADIRALGVVLLQALRSFAADSLPFPFREVAQNCRTAGEIVAWLRSPEPAAPEAAPPIAPIAPIAPAAQDEITRRVLPDIPAKARDTIQGKATVVVGVAVDASGNVAKATLEPGGSPYFGALALEAARHWRFAPVEGAGPRNWILRFEIMPAETQVIALRVGRE